MKRLDPAQSRFHRRVTTRKMPSRKLLDLTLIALLGGFAGQAFAQEAVGPEPGKQAATTPAPAAELQCGDSACSVDGKPVIKIISRGETQSHDPSPSGLQQQRRVDVQHQVPAYSVSGSAPIDLPNGGLIWATEDPQLASPSFTVSANSLAAFDNGRIVEPVRFHSYTNYAAFAKTIELRIFNGTDTDLVAPLATLQLPVANVGDLEWDGTLPAGLTLRQGDDLQYVARVIAADGSFDETVAQRIQLVRPEDLKRQQQQLLNSADSTLAGLSATQIEDRRQLDQTYGRNSLRIQNIPVYGSTVRVRGEAIPDGMSVRVNGENLPIDQQRKFVAEYLLPVGKHPIDVEIVDQGKARHESLDVDVTGRYLFLVALADVTLSQNSVSGAVVPVGVADQYDGFLSEGRLAFYLKGKVQGKYLVTAQADTHEREVKQLFNGFLEPDARDVFRRLDPDQYYPVYGDDSTTYRDVDTQGKLYVRIDWDKNQVLWGNFATGFTGNEYGQYVRSLYGAAASWRSAASTQLGDARTSLRAFGSETQTALGHSEFLGTGGSLYYLRNTDVLPGSDAVVLEVRDRTTGRIEARKSLVRGADYEIDELQGRLILTRPLAQITRENVPSIIRDAPLDGFESRLLADYEYIPSGFSPNQVAAGVQGRTWLGEHVAIGGTYVDENRSGDDYGLKGLDLTLQAGKGTYLKLEQARSESTSAPIFYSDDGGLSFSQLNAVTAVNREGEARSAEARANFKELGWTHREWTAGAWWRNVDDGFSVARQDYGQQIRETGAEFAGQATDAIRLSGRYSDARRGTDGIEQLQLLMQWRLQENSEFSGELRRVTETRSGLDASGTLAALRYTHRFGTSLDLYGVAQLTLDDDNGTYAGNDLYTVGAKYLFGNLSAIGAEVSSGDRGDAVTLNGEWRLTAEHSLYAGYTYSTDRTAADPLFGTSSPTGLTVGQRWRVSDQVNLFNESQFLKERESNGIAHTFGMDFYPAKNWNLGFTLQKGELESALGITDRKAVSVSGGYTSVDTTWNSKLEYRRDTGLSDREQWVSTNRVLYKVNEDWRLAARVNYGDTKDTLDPLANARFVESNLGFAYRPAQNDRWNVLGKFTYLYDVNSLGQDGLSDYDQRSQILSLEGIYRATDKWEFAGKIARRDGDARISRNVGPWFDSTANFGSVQARFQTHYKWDALAEYRVLDVAQDSSRREGWLVGVDRHISQNFRVGLGYNFTSFSDNLTIIDFDQKGWFLNINGTY